MIESTSLTANMHFLVMHAIEVDPTAPAPMKSPSTPESLRVFPASSAPPTGKIAAIDYFRLGSTCEGTTTPTFSATKGTLLIDRIDLDSAYTGVADFRTAEGHNRVTFTATPCDPLAVEALLAGNLACN